MFDPKNTYKYNQLIEEYTLKYKVPPIKIKRMMVQAILGFFILFIFIGIIIFQLIFNNGFEADSGIYYPDYNGTRIMIYIIAGLLFGFILHRSFFGFSNAFLKGVRDSQYKLAKSLILLLIISTIFFSFANLLINSSNPISSTETIAHSTKISLGFIIGGILFGVGMNLAGSSPSGILKSFGEGGGKSFIILFSIALGSTIGLLFAYPLMGTDPTIIESGYKFLGRGKAVNFWVEWGVMKGMLLNLVILGVIYLLLLYLEKIKKEKYGIIQNPKPDHEKDYLLNRPAYIKNETCSRIYYFLFKRRISKKVGAILIAIITIAMYLNFDGNFGFATTFGMWGLYVTNWFVDPASIEIIGYPIALVDPKLAMVSSGLNGFWHDPYSWLNISVIGGAIISFLIQGNFTFRLKNVNFKIFAYCFIGGLIMGFGSALANGGNMANLYEATTTCSVSGYVWIALLFITSFVFINFSHHHKHSQ